MLFTLSYLSRAEVGMDDPERDAIGAVSLSRNKELDVTGALYSGPDLFFQVLEGDRDAVEHIYALIRKDKRHSNVTTLRRRSIASRRFSGWSMKIVRPGALGPQAQALSFAGLANEPSFEDTTIDALRKARAGDVGLS